MKQKLLCHKWGEGNILLPSEDLRCRLIFVDPPYNYGVDYHDDPTGDKITPDEYESWTGRVVEELAPLVVPGGMIWWLTAAEHAGWTWDILSQYGPLIWGRPIIWHERFSQYKEDRLTGDYRVLFPLVPLTQEKTVFHPDRIRVVSERMKLGDRRANMNGRVPGHVWEVRRLQGTSTSRVDWHSAQLPPEPLERIVRGFSNDDDWVMDAMCGSMSMGVVCRKIGRPFIGVDQSQTYLDKGRERLEEIEWGCEREILPLKIRTDLEDDLVEACNRLLDGVNDRYPDKDPHEWQCPDMELIARLIRYGR